uniref:Uncharacterized protein n=1 Tax=Anopheles dirus TaxID=7168 RepID=A0A1Y9H244_9DIPT
MTRAGLLLGLVLVLFAHSTTSCQLELTQAMLQRLTKTNEQDCAKLWSNLREHLYRTHQNLTSCRQREETSKEAETAGASCQPQLDDAMRRANETHRQITAKKESQVWLIKLEGMKSKSAVRPLRASIQNITAERKGLYQSLLLLYIDAGNVRRTLSYYHRLRALKEPNLHATMVRFTYSSARHETRRLENLLTVTRHLPTDTEKMALYRLVHPEIVKRKTQSLRYVAMVAALDLAAIVLSPKYRGQDRQLYQTLFEGVMKQFKRDMLAGNYRDIIDFATNYPTYFDQVEARIAFIGPKIWPRINYDQYVTYANRLPQAKQRLQALRQMLLQIRRNNKQNFAYHLAKLAKQVDICETFMKGRHGELKDRDDLVQLKLQFAELDPSKNYEHYLKLQVTRPPVSRRRSRGRR